MGSKYKYISTDVQLARHHAFFRVLCIVASIFCFHFTVLHDCVIELVKCFNTVETSMILCVQMLSCSLDAIL